MFLNRGHIGKDSAPSDFAAPAAILPSCATESRFLRFYHRRDPYRYTVYIFNLLHYIYSFGGLTYAVSTPCISCIPFKDRYFALLFLTSTILLRFHCLFAFWSVFQPSRCGRYAFLRRVSLDELGIPLDLCMFSIRLHSSHFSFFRT